LIYLYRLPKRQWIKSFSIGANYNALVLQQETADTPPTSWNTVFTADHVYQKETIIYKDIVYLHWLPVGKVIDDTIFVSNKNFIEEVKELWSPQFQIILDANPPQQREESLILDF